MNNPKADSKTLFKVMLATDAETSKLRFPLLASPKLDGVRAYVKDGVVMSRSNKPIPNTFVQMSFGHLEHFDGELIVGDPRHSAVYRETVSHVMSHDKEGFDLRFYVFDHVEDLCAGYLQRADKLSRTVIRAALKNTSVLTHTQTTVTRFEHLLKYEEQCLDEGYEGLILRDPYAPYKCGRSTVKEGYLLKLKRFVDDEAVVINFEERQHNGNEATVSELGRTKRSSHKAGKSGRGDLGSLVVRHKDGVEFNIGTGFTDAERTTIWDNRDQYLGKLVKYKSFPVGVKTAPRHPVFLGWRDGRDL